MKFPRDQYRLLGRTGLAVPPVVFGTAALGNVGHVITDQSKLTICGEWFRQFAPPVWIETSYRHGNGMAVEILGRLLRRLDVSGDEVMIQLALSTVASSRGRGALPTDAVAEQWEKSCRLLGDEYRPKLLSTDAIDDGIWRTITDMKSANDVLGVGIAASDWRTARDGVAAFEPDWVMLNGCTVMRHSQDVLDFMSTLAVDQTPIVLTGIFEGGFLVGGNRLDGRALSAEDAADRSLLARRKAFVALCDGHGVYPAHACIQFALAAPGVVAVRLETSYADRVAENAKSVREKVPENLWQSMKEEGLLVENYPV